MSDTIDENTSPAPWDDALWKAADLLGPMAIRTAATLRIPDHVAAGRDTLTALAAATGSRPRALAAVLAQLRELDVLEAEEPCGPESRHRVTARGLALCGDGPNSMRPWIDVHGATGRADLCAIGLPDSVRTGCAAYPALFGRDFWADLAADPALRRSFDERMSTQIDQEVSAVEGAVDWTRSAYVVDVGGGDGTLLCGVVARVPHLRGLVFDRPGSAAAARARIAGAGLTGRIDVRSGDFFDGVPAGADTYLLGEVVHDWDDDAAGRILRRCADAMSTGGRILLIELLDGGSGQSPEMDLRMLTYFGGRERDLGELAGVAVGAGLEVTSTRRAGTRVVVELRVGER